MKRLLIELAIVAVAAIAIGYNIGPQLSAQPTTGAASENADHEAIRKGAREFEAAFNKGDAKAIAALWTENGEYREPDGATLLGRAAIEKAYTEFFKANTGAKVEVLVKSVRFPAKDMAVEEGLVRRSHGPRDLPSSTAYVAVHIREGGQWKIALSSAESDPPDRL